MNLSRKYTTKDLVIGQPEAEAEASKMLNLYEDYMGVNDAIKKNRFIITGRKGSGKSAYAVWLNEEAKTKLDMWCKIIKHNDRLLEQVLHMSTSSSISQEVLFEWLIIYNLIILITSSGEGQYAEFSGKLYEFKKSNAKLMNEGIFNLESMVSQGGIDLTSLRVPLIKIFGNIEKKLYKADFLTTLHYLKTIVIYALQQDNLKNIKFYIIFDDLDVKFKLNSEEDKVRLTDLIRTVRDYNTNNLHSSSSRVILLLRDDISSKLSGVECDTNKILASYEHRINWYRPNDEENLLQRFINHRISIALKSKGISNAMGWNDLVEPYFYEKPSFKYVLDHTFYLPRDIMLIFSDIDLYSFTIPLNQNNIDELLVNYSKAKHEEIRNELVVVWNEKKTDLVFEMLDEFYETIRDNDYVDYEMVQNLLSDYNLNEEDLDILIEYSIIVPKESNSNRIFVKYREKVPSRRKQKYHYTLHKALWLYFNTMQ